MDDLFLKFTPKPSEIQIDYQDKMMLIGSCFTEHIGNFLDAHKFTVLQNPNGIIFDTLSVCRTLNSYLAPQPITKDNLFFYNELWQHWQYHSKFSNINVDEMLTTLNAQKDKAAQMLHEANWLVITLGSSYAYKLKADVPKEFAIDNFVANCHKAPSQWFEKYLIPIDEQIASLDQTIYRIRKINPELKVIFTISPVRHIRDGIIENNRSKARLIETVHHLINKFNQLYYFPAYEILIDVLRDYRYYDVDMVHPNYLSTSKVLQMFIESYFNQSAQEVLEQIKQIVIAKKHKAFQPNTVAHKKFLLTHLEKTQNLQKQYPFLNLATELDYFADVIV
jgi:hypothetical protein